MSRTAGGPLEERQPLPLESASSTITPWTGSVPSVFLYVPNLIGYARVILTIASLVYMPHQPVMAMGCYATSCLLDAFDGYAARYLNQTSKFGAVLDMVTDRCSTLCLMMQLCHFYPTWTLAFQLLAALDLASHYMQMYTTATVLGSASHKQIPENAPWLLRAYYTQREVLFLVCAGNEAFFIALYVLHFVRAARSTDDQSTMIMTEGVVRWVGLGICGCVALFKNGVNVLQLVHSAQILAKSDEDAVRKGKRKAT